MPSYRTSTVISRPLADVFAYLTNISAWSDWMNVEGMHPLDDAPPRVGQRAEGQLREGQRTDPFGVEITQLEPGRRVGFKTVSGPIEWSGSWEVRAVDAGHTEVTAEGEMRLKGLRRLLEPLMAGEIRKGEAAELVKLRAKLEHEGGN